MGDTDFLRLHTATHSSNPTLHLPKNRDHLEWLLFVANEIVEAWPKMSLRNIGQMTKNIAALKEALTAFNETR